MEEEKTFSEVIGAMMENHKIKKRHIKAQEMNDWINWYGGPMPVDGEQGVCVRKSHGGEYGGKAKDFNWEVVDGQFDYTTIEAYRVLGQEKIQPNKNTETMEQNIRLADVANKDAMQNSIAMQASHISALHQENEKLRRWVDKLINALGK